MADTRKEIIIKEILYWKESRLLPEQYCNYLLALYTEGNQPEEVTKGKNKRTRRAPFPFKTVLPLLLLPIAFCVLYFTELSFGMQMSFFVILLLLGFALTYYFFKKEKMFQIPLVISAFMLLLTSIEWISHTFPDALNALYAILVVNCALWLLAGWKLKLLYFLISGVLGVLLLIISLFL